MKLQTLINNQGTIGEIEAQKNEERERNHNYFQKYYAKNREVILKQRAELRAKRKCDTNIMLMRKWNL